MAAIAPAAWYIPDTVGFVRDIPRVFKVHRTADVQIDDPANHAETVRTLRYSLFPQQRFIRDYLQAASPYRGLLLFHGLGVGKTCASIAVAEGLRAAGRRVVVMTPASLERSYIEQLQLCGHEYYTPKQHWSFIPAADLKDIEHPVSAKLVRRHGGVWIPDARHASNWATLGVEAQQQIQAQIRDVIHSHYEFIHYNGITRARVAEWRRAPVNPFSHAVVIIDEVHNFISRVTRPTTTMIARDIYELLMHAENTKIVCLSGTPVINDPFELAYLLSLVRGPQTLYRFRYKEAAPRDELLSRVLAHPRVLRAHAQPTDFTLTLQLTPPAFIKVNGSTRLQAAAYVADDTALLDIIQTAHPWLLSRWTQQESTALPLQREDFYALFVGPDGTVRNEDLFMRRILGTVSVYMETDKAHFPSIVGNSIQTVNVPLSDAQFHAYLKVRVLERMKENRAARFLKAGPSAGDKGPSSVYRAFSRAVSLFTFPKHIERRYPSQMRQLAKEMDLTTDDTGESEATDTDADTELADAAPQGQDKQARAKEYARMLQMAKDQLAADAQTYLVDQLALYSPKYAAILDRIETSPGPVLVYSQYKQVEGLGVFCMALDAHGYAPLRVRRRLGAWELDMDPADISKPKYLVFSNEEPEAMEVLKAVFNATTLERKMPQEIEAQLLALYPGIDRVWNHRGQLVKILMITQSGAEGLNLKNVRQVHIMEPYWNMIRVEQVLGRAVRTGSHVSLPPAERNVACFMYISTFTRAQLSENYALRSADGGQTSDEAIYDKAVFKNRLNGAFLELVKRAAVDCRVHKAHHREGTDCYSYAADRRDDEFGVAWSLEEDRAAAATALAPRIDTRTLRPVSIHNVPYLYDTDTGELYDRHLYDTTGQLVRLGSVTPDPDNPGYVKFVLIRQNESKNNT